MAGTATSALSKFSAWIILWVFICSVATAQQPKLRPLNLTGTFTRAEIFKKIEEQTGFAINFADNIVDIQERIYVNFRNAVIDDVMGIVLQGEFVSWELFERTKGILIKKEDKKYVYTPKAAPVAPVTGLVTDKSGQPIPGASISVNGSFRGTSTDGEGRFRIEGVPDNATLLVRSVGFMGSEQQLNGQRTITFALEASVMTVQAVEIVATGFQQVPAERSTGSFVGLNNQMINRRQTGSIIDRLEGITSGLLSFTTQTQGAISKMPSTASLGVNLRGISSLSPNNVNPNPLIVLDNFPYEGDIRNLNPNDIESITILKDAASASIWGSRSGNGVIVLSTKKGKPGQKMQLGFNTNVTISSRPDVYYDPNYISSSDFIDIEDSLYRANYFNTDFTNRTTYPPLSPAMEIRRQQRLGLLSATDANAQIAALKQYDVREDFLQHIYRPGVNQQYAVNVRGGSDNMTYYLSVGHDRGQDNLIGNNNTRTTVTAANTLTPFKGLEVAGYINYSYNNIEQPNELRFGTIASAGKYGTLYPYARLADAAGNALPVIKDYSIPFADSVGKLGYQDWLYRPLDEIHQNQNATALQDLIIRVAAKYRIAPFLVADVQYQNERQVITSTNLRNEGAYFTRNQINRFSQRDAQAGTFKYNFPQGGILSLGNFDWRINNLRANLNFDKKFGEHAINAILGSEIRELTAVGTERTSLGYDPATGTGIANLNFNLPYPTFPSGISYTLNDVLPSSNDLSKIVNRFVSYYFNGGYSFRNRYDLTVSGRVDGTNLFGVSTNKKMVPLWSLGAGWDIDQESFYSRDNWMQKLRLRVSTGYNGNVYNGSAYLTGSSAVDPMTGLPIIGGIVPENDELRWERVKIMNAAVDFASRGGRLSGSIEYFDKKGIDLIERSVPSPQTGYAQALRNSAATSTTGFDVTINGRIIDKKVKWNATLLFSQLKDRVTAYEARPGVSSAILRDPTGITFVVGKPVKAILSYRSAGLDPANGDPMGYLNGRPSKEWANIINTNNLNTDSLVYHGSAYPTLYGSLRNDFSYKRLSLSFNIVYKLGYYFRRPGVSLVYPDLLRFSMHEDYSRRWQKVGDELITDVPSVTFPGNAARNSFYQMSDVLVEKGDHIRLQDIRIAYTLPGFAKKNPLQVYSYLNNVGILWRANKYGLDPDVINLAAQHNLPRPFSITFGVQTSF